MSVNQTVQGDSAQSTAQKQGLAKPVLAVAALLWAMLLAMAASALMGIIVALRIEGQGLNSAVTGVVMASYFAGLVIGAWYSSNAINSIGHIRAFAASATLVSASFIMFPLAEHWLAWSLFRFFAGLGFACMITAVEAWLNDRTPSLVRGSVLAVYVVVSTVAQLLGQLMVNIWPISQAEPFMIASILLSLSLLPVTITRMPAPELTDVEPFSMKELYHTSPTAITGCIGSGLLIGMTLSFAAIFAKRLGFSLAETSYFASALIAGGALFLFPIGAISDRMDRRLMLVAVLLGGALFAALLVLGGFIGFPPWIMIILAMLFGGMMYAIYPLAQTQVFDYIPQRKYTSAAAGLNMTYSVGATLGPLLISFILDWHPSALFMGIALISGFVGIFVLYRMSIRDSLPIEEQETVTLVTVAPSVESLAMGFDVLDEADTPEKSDSTVC